MCPTALLPAGNAFILSYASNNSGKNARFLNREEKIVLETGKLNRSLTVCNKTQGRTFNADGQLPLEANWSSIKTRNNT